MRSPFRFLATGALVAAALAGAWPGAAHAQAFEADYQLIRPHAAARLDFSRVRVVPLAQSGAAFSGAGLAVYAGNSWFGQLGMERSVAPELPGHARSHVDVVNLGAGYRFSNGQSLSLQLSHGHGRGPGQRLGLAVNYDWPHYFVRFSYDQGVNLVPQDNLRFSAGVRF